MIPDPLDCDTVRVRWLPVAGADAHLPRWRAMLDAGERTRADRFCFDADRNTFTAAHALTRAMLSGATGRPTADWRYVQGRFGKPALADGCAAGGLHFNLSHTRGFVACALMRGTEIGMDVDASDRNTNLGIAGRFFAPEEARLVEATPPERRAAVFFRFWTLKEAFIKATGEGLRRPLDSFSFSFDPLRIRFHPEREDTPRHDDPAAWQFHELLPAPHRPLALAVRRPRMQALRIDARAAPAEAVAPLEQGPARE